MWKIAVMKDGELQKFNGKTHFIPKGKTFSEIVWAAKDYMLKNREDERLRNSSKSER